MCYRSALQRGQDETLAEISQRRRELGAYEAQLEQRERACGEREARLEVREDRVEEDEARVREERAAAEAAAQKDRDIFEEASQQITRRMHELSQQASDVEATSKALDLRDKELAATFARVEAKERALAASSQPALDASHPLPSGHTPLHSHSHRIHPPHASPAAATRPHTPSAYYSRTAAAGTPPNAGFARSDGLRAEELEPPAGRAPVSAARRLASPTRQPSSSQPAAEGDTWLPHEAGAGERLPLSSASRPRSSLAAAYSGSPAGGRARGASGFADSLTGGGGGGRAEAGYEASPALPYAHPSPQAPAYRPQRAEPDTHDSLESNEDRQLPRRRALAASDEFLFDSSRPSRYIGRGAGSHAERGGGAMQDPAGGEGSRGASRLVDEKGQVVAEREVVVEQHIRDELRAVEERAALVRKREKQVLPLLLRAWCRLGCPPVFAAMSGLLASSL